MPVRIGPPALIIMSEKEIFAEIEKIHIQLTLIIKLINKMAERAKIEKWL